MLADCGVASRRKAEEMIANGQVRVNGVIAKIGDKVDPKKDKISVNGKPIVSQRNVYYMLHKPGVGIGYSGACLSGGTTGQRFRRNAAHDQ